MFVVVDINAKYFLDITKLIHSAKIRGRRCLRELPRMHFAHFTSKMLKYSP